MTHTQQLSPPLDRFLRRPEVEKITGVPCSTIYWLMSRSQFPKPYRLSARMVGWKESELREWQASRAQSLNKAA